LGIENSVFTQQEVNPVTGVKKDDQALPTGNELLGGLRLQSDKDGHLELESFDLNVGSNLQLLLSQQLCKDKSGHKLLEH